MANLASLHSLIITLKAKSLSFECLVYAKIILLYQWTTKTRHIHIFRSHVLQKDKKKVSLSFLNKH
jgi:hypothetical protein